MTSFYAVNTTQATQEELTKIGKKLKKNNVALDIVSFGDDEVNAEKLEALIAAVDSNENSHIVTVPAGTVLSDMLFGSPIFHPDGTAGYGGAGGAAGGEGAGGDGFDFVDPNIDPELALALRVSLEEERARQNAAATAAGGEAAPAPAAATAADAGAFFDSLTDVNRRCWYPGCSICSIGAADGTEAMALDEDALLQQALAMSMQVDEDGAGGAAAMDTDLDAALALSMAEGVRDVVSNCLLVTDA